MEKICPIMIAVRPFELDLGGDSGVDYSSITGRCQKEDCALWIPEMVTTKEWDRRKGEKEELKDMGHCGLIKGKE